MTLLGIAWVCTCLVLTPMVFDWLEPQAAPPLVASHPRDVPRRTEGAPLGSERGRTLELEAPRRIDLYGNEIANPVARYRVDDRGTLYEVHSPETEVPRLAAPRL